MLAHTARTAVVATLLAALFSQARAEAPPNDAAPVRGLVLLHNGEVIEGKITKFQDLYLVDLDHGRIRLKQSDVELVCSSLADGYQQKRAKIQVGNIHDHLELAQWCLRHNLLGPASVELADATTADPKNPMIGALQHRLKMAMEPPPPAAVKNTAAQGPSNDELDRMLRAVPRAAVETFTQNVQPVLLNRCASSGCHGSQSTSPLKLYRAAGAASSRRATQRNLYSVLQFIDYANPSASRLLTASSQAHGTAKHPVFSEREGVQFQHLVDWANQLAGRPLSNPPASIARGGPAKVVEPLFDDAAPDALPRESRNARPMTAAERRHTAHRPGTAAKQPEEATPAAFDQPADPTDPDVFNRRYASENAKPSEPPKKPAK
jgi:hypothetical protein